jgi:hypothetical protein
LQDGLQQQQQQQQHLSPLIHQSFTATLCGFQPQEAEEAYASWMAEKCVLWINTWNVLFLSWVMACVARSAKEGDTAFWAHLPGHLLHLGPLVVTAVITACRKYR